MSNYTAGSRNTKEKKNQQANDTMVNRMMALFCAAVVYVVGLLLIKKNGGSFEVRFVMHALPIIQLVTGLLFAGMVAFFLVNKKRGVDESAWFINTRHMVVLSFILFASAVLYTYVGNSGMVIGVIALLVAACVYCFYQREFFVYTIFAMAASLGLYGVKGGYSASPVKFVLSIVLSVLAFAAPVIMLIVTAKMKKNGGKLTFGKKTVEIMKKDSTYLPFIIGSVYVLAAAVVGIIFNQIALYTLIAFLFLYLVFAIVYTVKMI